MTSKRLLGQYYTTNAKYILSGTYIPDGVDIVEPFVGNGDLLNIIDPIKHIECYDIEPKINGVIKQDTLLYPPEYTDKFVITNPPYLYRNKSVDKTIYNRWNTDDLYKCFIKSLNNAIGGIIIIPLNFLCSNDYKIRDIFFSSYKPIMIKVFEETIFDDTDIQCCVIQFERNTSNTTFHKVDTIFIPHNERRTITIDKRYKWLFGGEIFKNINSPYKIGRLLEGMKPTSNIKLYATDTGGDKRIRLEVDDPYFGKITDRNVCTITTNIPIVDEKRVCDEFNTRIEHYRKKYNSMFLTSFHNSTSYARKRISFTQTFKLIKMILSDIDNDFFS